MWINESTCDFECAWCRELTDGDPHGQSCSHQTAGRGSTDPGGSVDEARDVLQETAQSAQVINTPEATACKGDVPLLVPIKHLLWGSHQFIHHVSSVRVQQVYLDSLQYSLRCKYDLISTTSALSALRQCCPTYPAQISNFAIPRP